MKIRRYRALSVSKRMKVRLALLRKRAGDFLRHPTFDFRAKLVGMSLLSPVIPIVAGALTSQGLLGPRAAFACHITGGLLGFLVLATLANRFVDRHFAEFRAAKLVGLALIGFATYCAQGPAAVEVNAIFQVDAAALPKTTAAAAAMVLANWIFSAAALPILFGSIALVFYFAGMSRLRDMAIAFAICMSSALWGGLINFQSAPDAIRKSNLYQIALAMDFNKRSTCAGVPGDAEGVVFLGPEQRRAIVAPRLKVIHQSADSIFMEVQVPDKFEKVECP